MARSRGLAVPAALLLLAVASASAVGVAAKTNAHDVAEGGGKEEESWTDWAKDKISEGLGLKHVDEEEAARKAGHTAKSARESAQHAASGNKLPPPPFPFPTSTCSSSLSRRACRTN
jgi:Spy/CpxP family protein refolding chaperone